LVRGYSLNRQHQGRFGLNFWNNKKIDPGLER